MTAGEYYYFLFIAFLLKKLKFYFNKKTKNYFLPIPTEQEGW